MSELRAVGLDFGDAHSERPEILLLQRLALVTACRIELCFASTSPAHPSE